jgi:hypothetical protein
MACNCIAEKNEYLSQWDTELNVTLGDDPRVIIGVISTSPGRIPVALVADFCPFCGQAYADEAAR